MLYDKLEKYAKSGSYPMHMPGHKRNAELLPIGLPYDIDISEIFGFDNMHDPQGLLKELAELAAELYGSTLAFPLINGSTAGIMAAIGAHAKHGEKILLARNCHISAYNAMTLFGLSPVYILPETENEIGIAGSIDPMSVKSVLESNPDIKLIVITSPTYEGIISDVASIAAIAHESCVPVLVDSAHGAHLGFSGGFPESAVKAGADLVVMSLHKTLPALTQCALLHICSERADANEVARLLSVFQTSSPSYVLLASIDSCLRLLVSEGSRLFREYEDRLNRFSREVAFLEKLSIFPMSNENTQPAFPAFYERDPSKIVIATNKTMLNGSMLSDQLRFEHRIEIEMACAEYALAMTSICDTREGFARLAEALLEIDKQAQYAGNGDGGSSLPMMPKPGKLALPESLEKPGEAIKGNGRFIPIGEALGFMSLEYVWAYPPGIPIIVPGELINADIVAYIEGLMRAGIVPKSQQGEMPEYIYAVGNLSI